MRLFSWLSSIQKSLNKARARRSRRSFGRMERLEDRTLLAAVVESGTDVAITVDTPGEFVSLYGSGLTAIAHSDLTGDTVLANAAADITSVDVAITAAGTTTDLSGVTGTGFVMLLSLQGAGAAALVKVTGSADADTIIGSTINDSINGGDGGDSINGGGGNDLIDAGAGDDSVTGGAGYDTIRGGAGSDTLNGGDDADTILGGADNDSIFGGGGEDSLNGEAGNDTIDGEAGDDYIKGDAGADSLLGGDGSDQILGGTENDTIDGGAGVNTLKGEAGDDTIVWTSGDATETLDGGSGSDTLSIQGTIGDDTIGIGQTAAGKYKITGAGGLYASTVSLENIEVDALDGNDTINISNVTASVASTFTVHGNEGKDRIDATNAVLTRFTVELDGDEGSDIIIGSKNATREAFKNDLLSDGQVWMDMIKARNQTPHTYNTELAESIVKAILTQFFPAFVDLETRFSQLEP